MDKPEDFQPFNTASYKPAKRIMQYYSTDSRYFLNVIFTAIASGESPYTFSTSSGISRASLASLFQRLYSAYRSEVVQNKDSYEWLLFLANAENIYHPSLLCEIFKTYRESFNQWKKDALPGFITSLNLINLVNSLYLPALQIDLWKKFNKVTFTSPEHWNETQLFLSMQINLLNTFSQQIHDLLSQWITYKSEYVSISDLDKREKNLRRPLNKKAKEALLKDQSFAKIIAIKKEIVDYLYEYRKYFSWSLFETMSDKEYNPSDKHTLNDEIKLSTTFNEYIDFYIVYLFYSNPQQVHAIMNDFFNDHGDYNLYLKHIFDRKR